MENSIVYKWIFSTYAQFWSISLEFTILFNIYNFIFENHNPHLSGRIMEIH